MKFKVDYFGFVYLWFDKKNKRYYVGSAMRSITCGYKCSNKHLNAAIAKRPNDFKRRVIFYLRKGGNTELKKEEQRWLDMIDRSQFGKKYYNWNPYATGGRGRGYTNSPESNLKRSLALKGKAKPEGFGLGRKQSDETRQKISIAHRGKHHGRLGKKINRIAPPWNKGVPMSDEQKEKLRQINLGKTLSEEHRKAIGDGLRGKTRGPYKRK